MFEEILVWLRGYPYLGPAVVFVLCGLGLPLPEEIVLLAAGYLCAEMQGEASLPLMMLSCAGAIMIGDLLPFVGGRVFGVRLLRLRWMRYFVTKQRLANFDRWFRRRGDLVIIIARFLAGLRVVAFFTAGTMKMSWRRFLLLDGFGIVLMVPLLTWLGYRGAGFIKTMIQTVQKIERGMLWGLLAAVVLGVLFFWLRRRRASRRAQKERPTEAFVQPQVPVQEPPPRAPTEPLKPNDTANAIVVTPPPAVPPPTSSPDSAPAADGPIDDSEQT